MPNESGALRRVINAWGTATPFGVSRSGPEVAAAVAAILQRYVPMSDLQAQAGQAIARWSGAEAGCVTHSTAAAITLAVAGCMTGRDAGRIARLPDAQDMPSRVAMLAAHQVNYGHSMLQAVRLAGATPVVCADSRAVQAALAQGSVACVLAVESHLAAGSGPAVTAQLLALARAASIPLVLDAAAQDWRARELVAAGPDLVLVSAQKYLRGPTAGLVMGRAELVAAVEAQHGGIGRAMKPTKEAMAGVIAALQAREEDFASEWLVEQRRKVDTVMAAVSRWKGIGSRREADPQGNGFDRIWISTGRPDASGLIRQLRDGDPVVAVAPHRAAKGEIGLELTGVDEDELPELLRLLQTALA
jgi:uncharacterized pyridoxal phosphate-dependent enzyme